MSYTTAGEDGPGWLNRLPRITSTSRSQAKSMVSDADGDELKMHNLPPGVLPPVGLPREFLRRQKEEDNPSHPGSRASSLIPRRRKKKNWDDGVGPGGPISQSAIFPQRRSQSAHQSENTSDTMTPGDQSPKTEKDVHTEKDEDSEKNERDLGDVQDDPEMHEILHRHSDQEEKDQHRSDAERHPEHTNLYQEGDDVIIEDNDGEVLAIKESPSAKLKHEPVKKAIKEWKEDIEHPDSTYKNLRKKLGVWRHKDEPEEEGQAKTSKGTHKKRGPALAYQFGNTIIVEDEDGEVVKTYELPPSKQNKPGESSTASAVIQNLTRVGTWTGKKQQEESNKAEASPAETPEKRPGLFSRGTWGFGSKDEAANHPNSDDDDDRRIRFKIGGAGRRLTKDDFLKEIQSLDPKARCEIIAESDAPAVMKDMAKKDASRDSPGSSRIFDAKNPQVASGKGVAKAVGAEMARLRGANIDESGSEDSEEERIRRKRARGVLDLAKKRDPMAAKASTTTSSYHSSSNEVPESEAERKRREDALRGVDDVMPAQRGRPREVEEEMEFEESAAEKRRREAALGLGGSDGQEEESDSDDDDTPRVPPPVARSRGIRFAQSPVRGRH